MPSQNGEAVDSPEIGAWSDSYALQVCAVSLEAEHVIGITLREEAGRDLPAWSPGAHIELILPSGLVRQFSLCGTPRDRETYRIAVLREENGRGGSAELHDSPLVGRRIKVRGPRNHFDLVNSSKYIFIAGGIGITPILAMIRELPSDVAWSLYYGGRTRRAMAFADEAAAIGGDRTHLFPKDERGRLDIDLILTTADIDTAVYCCGPSAMIEAVQAGKDVIAPDVSLHFERFTAPGAAKALATAAIDADLSFEVELRRSNVVLVVPPDRTLLSVVRDVLPDAPSSCEEGYCGTCETRVLQGIPDHRDELLTEEERAANKTMMICVSRARSERIVLDL